MQSAEKADKFEKVNLDYILIEEVGQFGRYQWLTLALAALPAVFFSFTYNDYVFTTARITSRCLIPECDDVSPVFATPWQEHAIPRLPSGAFDQCSRFPSNSSQWVNGTCPASLFDTSNTQTCEQYVYENDNTIVYDFDLACSEWKRSWAGSIKIMGTLLGLSLTGFISDRWGRRVALVFNVVNSTWLGVARSFVNTYEWFIALQFIESTLGSGVYSCCYILDFYVTVGILPFPYHTEPFDNPGLTVSELVGPNYRVLAGTLISTMLSLGQGALGLLAWAVPHWRALTRVLYGPQLLILSYIWLISESVRWLLSNQRFEEAEKVLKQVAKKNKKNLSEKSLKALRMSAKAEINAEKAKEPWLPIIVYRSKAILLRCCITPIWWITNTLVIYGLNINAVNLGGNSNLNYSFVALMDIPGRRTAFFLLDRLGRKPVIFVGYFLCSSCQYIFAFLPEGMDGLSMAVYLISKSCIAGVTLSIYVYTTELYPTKHRHQLFAFSSMVGRIGSIVVPLTPALAQEVWAPLPSVLFGSCALLSALLILTTPETLGTKLPETMEDAENISNNKITA